MLDQHQVRLDTDPHSELGPYDSLSFAGESMFTNGWRPGLCPDFLLPLVQHSSHFAETCHVGSIFLLKQDSYENTMTTALSTQHKPLGWCLWGVNWKLAEKPSLFSRPSVLLFTEHFHRSSNDFLSMGRSHPFINLKDISRPQINDYAGKNICLLLTYLLVQLQFLFKLPASSSSRNFLSAVTFLSSITGVAAFFSKGSDSKHFQISKHVV